MDEYLSLLCRCPLFRGLSAAQIEERILPHARLSEYPKGAILLHPQQQLTDFAIVVSGTVHLVHITIDGDSQIMDSLEPGEVYGADLMCTRSRLSPYHAIAPQPCKMLNFPLSLVMEEGFLPDNLRHQVMLKLLKIIAHDNMRKDYRLAILSQKGLRDRLMTYLTMQAAKRGTSTFSIPFDREALASFLCVNRSALSHEITLMRREGLIECRKNVFTLLAWDADGAADQ